MSGAGVAAAGVAVAVYFYSRRRGGACGPPEPSAAVPPVERFRHHSHAPNTWLEALLYFAEAIRHIYGETLGTWRTADLLIGLAYLARRDQPSGDTLGDIAATGRPFGEGLEGKAKEAARSELATLRHCMGFGLALRQLRPAGQLAVFRSQGFAEEDFLVVQQRSGLLKPSYFLLRDHAINAIVLLIRGTQTVKDMFTSMTSASKPHHVVDADGVTLGYTHFGMLAAARWIRAQVMDEVRAALAANPGYRLQLVGHSMGAGTAAILTMMLREMPDFADATCIAIACPACMTLGLAQSCSGYVTTIINNTDMVPTMSLAAMDALREEVTQSQWAQDFRADMRSSVVVRAVENSLTTVGGGLSSVAMGTVAATSWTTQRLSQSFKACTFRRRPRPPAKKRKSFDNLVDLEAWATAEQAARQRRPAKKAARAQPGRAAADVAATPVRGGLGFGALTACTGRRRKAPVAANATAAIDVAGADSGVEDASQWIAEADGSDEVARGSILAAFQAWGWRADPQLEPRPSIVSSMVSAPAAAASYLYQWVPSLGWGRARRRSSSHGSPGGGGSIIEHGLRSPLAVRTTPPPPRGIAGRTGGLLSRVWLQRCSPTGAIDPDGPSTPPAGGSPRAASPPLERATSAPVFEDHMSVDGDSSGDEALSPDAAAPRMADAGAVLHRRHDSVVSSGNGNGSGRAGGRAGSVRTRSRSRHFSAASLGLHPAADGGSTSEQQFVSEDEQLEDFASPRSNLSGFGALQHGSLLGWEDYGELASPRQAIDEFVGPPRLMRMGFTSDSESDIEGDSDVEAFEQEVAEAQQQVEREEALERTASSRLSSLAGDSPPGSPGRSMTGEPAAVDGLPDTARAVDMRCTYPAGRILHLVPASLAFPAFGGGGATSRSSSSGLASDDDTAMADDSGPAVQRDRIATAVAAAVATVDGAAAIGRAAAEGASAASAVQRASDRAAAAGSSGPINSAAGSAAAASDPTPTGSTTTATAAMAAAAAGDLPEATKRQQEAAAAEPLWPGAAAAPAPEPRPLPPDVAERAGQTEAEMADPGQPCVLLEGIPHEMYGRMRLCRSMVADHFTPSYLRSMRAAVAAFEGGYGGYGPRQRPDDN